MTNQNMTLSSQSSGNAKPSGNAAAPHHCVVSRLHTAPAMTVASR